MQFFTLTLHGEDGILYRTECGETEFIIGQQTAPDVFTVSEPSVAQRHAMLWIGAQKLQVEQLEGETLVTQLKSASKWSIPHRSKLET